MVMMRLTGMLVLALGIASCDGRAAVQQDVRSFAAAVARDVTQQGPLAWSRYFEDTPAFFMAVNGQIAFASGQAARQGIPQVAQALRRIELHWGDELRVDPLTRELAVVGAPWREVLTDSAGHTVTQSGYFTALAEYHAGRWQFRDVHWSSPVAAPSAP